LDDATLRRFLRARSMDAAKAHRFLLRHVRWRAEFVPKGSIAASEVQAELRKGKVYLQGADRAGHPIVVLMASRHYASDRDLQEFKSKQTDVAMNPLSFFLSFFLSLPFFHSSFGIESLNRQ
jgi:hypothetical protein